MTDFERLATAGASLGSSNSRNAPSSRVVVRPLLASRFGADRSATFASGVPFECFVPAFSGSAVACAAEPTSGEATERLEARAGPGEGFGDRDGDFALLDG
jgi:hypothetical protein